MSSRLLCFAFLVILVTVACSEKNSPTEAGSVTLQVPDDYGTISAAAAQAQAGDCIVVKYITGGYEEDITLPPGVSMKAWTNTNGMRPGYPKIEGEVTVFDSDERTIIEGFHIENDAGNGLTVLNSSARIRECWLQRCGGAGISLSGFSPVHINDCDLDSCGTGVLIRDIGPGQGGHYSRDIYDDDGAARISGCNFLKNGDPQNSRHVVFHNVAVGDTVYVSHNYWQGSNFYVYNTDDFSQDGIIDTRDDYSIFGLADTEYSFYWNTGAYARDWND
ncbi:MAG: hypothetical protein GY835_08300 [bacterium]|nr:hypothetical protein [bacterium]